MLTARRMIVAKAGGPQGGEAAGLFPFCHPRNLSSSYKLYWHKVPNLREKLRSRQTRGHMLGM